ncbi:MAG: nuclear transport factor 2 family protein [Tissierellales bacterium]
MNDVEKLVAIEEIKQLKARYFRAMDFKDWTQLRSVFTTDAVFDIRAAFNGPEVDPMHSEPPLQGVDAIVAYASEGLANMVSMHYGHSPLIELQGPELATGLWPMEDWLYTPAGCFHGQGHYHETYIKQDGQWRIEHLRITRQHVTSDFDPTSTIEQ